MVYQEQVMQIAQVMGGYTLGGADLLRRAMGKKKADEMAEQRDIFVAGAEKNSLSKGKATQLFDLMEKFAGYGFNKSHAAAYALLAYQTAFMKTHHTAAFAAANLSAVMDDTDKVRQFHEDATANGITVLPPDVHSSEYRFTPVDRKTVRFGLGAVRGTGESAIAAVIEARKPGPFKDLFDFCRRVDKRSVNRRAVEALVRAGAFDSLDTNRARLLASVARAIEGAEQAERQASQNSLFGEAEVPRGGAHAYVEAATWDLKQKLMEEKTALGFYLSGHLFTVYEREISGFSRTALAKLAASQYQVTIAGIVASARTQMTRRGRMMVVMLDDGTAQLENSVFSELFDRHRDKMKEDALLIVQGKAQKDEFSGGLRVTAEELFDLESLRAKFPGRLKISMNGQADAKKLQQILGPYRGNGGTCKVFVRYQNDGAQCEVALGDTWRVRPDGQLINELSAWLAPDNVQLIFT
jgi:DNA polymerase-3 subunit alpha